jgi:hypothetical protein
MHIILKLKVGKCLQIGAIPSSETKGGIWLKAYDHIGPQVEAENITAMN